MPESTAESAIDIEVAAAAEDEEDAAAAALPLKDVCWSTLSASDALELLAVEAVVPEAVAEAEFELESVLVGAELVLLLVSVPIATSLVLAVEDVDVEEDPEADAELSESVPDADAVAIVAAPSPSASSLSISELAGANAATFFGPDTTSTAGPAAENTSVTFRGSAPAFAGPSPLTASPASVVLVCGAGDEDELAFIGADASTLSDCCSLKSASARKSGLSPASPVVAFAVVVVFADIFAAAAHIGWTTPVAESYANAWLLCTVVPFTGAASASVMQGSIVSGAGAGGSGSNVAQYAFIAASTGSNTGT